MFTKGVGIFFGANGGRLITGDFLKTRAEGTSRLKTAFPHQAFIGVWHSNEGPIAMEILHFSAMNDSKLSRFTLLHAPTEKIGCIK